jgi:hypothetical protein
MAVIKSSKNMKRKNLWIKNYKTKNIKKLIFTKKICFYARDKVYHWDYLTYKKVFKKKLFSVFYV